MKRYLKSCDICQRTVRKGRLGKALLDCQPIIDTPLKRVAIDLIGCIPPVSDECNRNIATMIYFATRYPGVTDVRSVDTEYVADIFSRYEIP